MTRLWHTSKATFSNFITISKLRVNLLRMERNRAVCVFRFIFSWSRFICPWLYTCPLIAHYWRWDLWVAPPGSDVGLGIRAAVVCYTPLVRGNSAWARNRPLRCCSALKSVFLATQLFCQLLTHLNNLKLYPPQVCNTRRDREQLSSEYRSEDRV